MSYARGRAFQSLGDSLRGIGTTVANLRREDEERERLDEQMKRQRAFEDANMALTLAPLGGGEGPAPPTERTLMDTGAPRPEFDPGPLVQPPDAEPAGAEGFMEVPEFERREDPVTLQESDPRFMDIADGRWHVMRPDALEQQRFETQQARERDAQEEWVRGVAPGIERFSSGELTPGAEGFGEEAARLMSQQVDPFGLMPQPEEVLPQIRLDEHFRPQGRNIDGTPMSRWDQPAGGAGAGGERFGTRISEQQAIDRLQQQFAVYQRNPETGVEELVGYSIPFPEIAEMARAMAAGQPLPSEPFSAFEPGDDRRSFDPQAAAQGLRRLPQSQWRAELMRVGYEPEEIEVILDMAGFREQRRR